MFVGGGAMKHRRRMEDIKQTDHVAFEQAQARKLVIYILAIFAIGIGVIEWIA